MHGSRGPQKSVGKVGHVGRVVGKQPQKYGRKHTDRVTANGDAPHAGCLPAYLVAARKLFANDLTPHFGASDLHVRGRTPGDWSELDADKRVLTVMYTATR